MNEVTAARSIDHLHQLRDRAPDDPGVDPLNDGYWGLAKLFLPRDNL